MKASQHLGDFHVFSVPSPKAGLVDVSEVSTISDPHLHFFAGSDRHQQKSFKLRAGKTLLAKSLHDVRADGFARSSHLIPKSELLDLGNDSEALGTINDKA